MVLSDDWWRNDVSWHALEEGYEAEKEKMDGCELWNSAR
jgi:hypothetical protein